MTTPSTIFSRFIEMLFKLTRDKDKKNVVTLNFVIVIITVHYPSDNEAFVPFNGVLMMLHNTGQLNTQGIVGQRTA